MTEKQAEQWALIAGSFREAAKEHTRVLENHPNAFNRGWIAGLRSAQQKALMFRYSALKTGGFIPASLRSDRSGENLAQDYGLFLIESAKSKTDSSLKEEVPGNHPMDNDMAAFHYGWIAGLENWQSSLKR